MRRRSPRRACSGARPTSPSARRASRPPSATVRATVVLDEADIELPDLLTDLQDRTQLTRRSIHRILTDSGRLDDFKRNPQAVHRAGRRGHQPLQAPGGGGRHQVPAPRRRALLRPGAVRAGGADRLPQEHARRREVGLRAGRLRLGHGTDFADELEKNDAIKVYAKLPGWFKVPTPLGTYNPDWAVLVEKDGAERLYFVVETKSSLFADDLRDKESAKIECGKAHFKALEVRESPAEYMVARSVDDVLATS